MALKDWTKIENTKFHIIWKNEYDSSRIMVFSRAGAGGWGFEVMIGGYTFFKTKSEALKFARDYMRRH